MHAYGYPNRRTTRVQLVRFGESNVSSALAAAIGDFEGLPIAGCVVELDGTLVAVNAASVRMLARPREQVLGKKVWDFAPGIEHIWRDILETIRRDGEARGQIAIATPLGPRLIQYVGGLRSYETRTLDRKST